MYISVFQGTSFIFYFPGQRSDMGLFGFFTYAVSFMEIDIYFLRWQTVTFMSAFLDVGF